jgi:hypothetical protein
MNSIKRRFSAVPEGTAVLFFILITDKAEIPPEQMAIATVVPVA